MRQETTAVVIIAVISILIFLLCREIVCWYFKINKRIEILEEQNELLKNIHKELKNEKVNNENTIANTI
ncbi:hypothetical protein LNI88_11570 [Tenacibaculum dicentrarchi]|nr:hypothetical protein [Tenacibaculum dicentrarchi]MCD8425999.1 hypothetical protein [Tenacibaculum dicentrarchi]MCD8443232.1 hypothetical protein [Tenacibaculum dicentrarchi]